MPTSEEIHDMIQRFPLGEVNIQAPEDTVGMLLDILTAINNRIDHIENKYDSKPKIQPPSNLDGR
jgi:hypothetical protein